MSRAKRMISGASSAIVLKAAEFLEVQHEVNATNIFQMKNELNQKPREVCKWKASGFVAAELIAAVTSDM